MMEKDLGRVQDVARMQGLYPFLEAEINQRVKALQNKVMLRLEAGDLTPDLALFAWMEYASLVKLVKSFDTRIRIAQAAAEKVASDLEG